VGEATPESRPDRPGQPNDAGAPNGAGGLDGAGQQRFFRGVAAVPQRPYADGETGELPLLRKPPSSQEYPLARPVGLRRRWRSLRRGGGWTMAGLWIAVICWGVWAVSVRDGDLVGPAFALGVLLAIGLLIFTVSRLLGRLVLEGMLGRPRPSAWPSHVLVFLLLVVGAVAFLQQTWWVMAAWNWIVGALA
jgi:hypothetical protein